jgi:hypothetical protein
MVPYKHEVVLGKCNGTRMVRYSVCLTKILSLHVGNHFKFFTNNSIFKYLVYNPLLEGRICRWLLLFHEFSFELIVKHGKNDVGLDLLSWMQSSELGGRIDD